MDKPVYIEKIGPDPDGLDFFSLKREGIAHLQNLCGKAWTDYNLHDPGVTILEQLCYALTDMAYRTEFDLADYLTAKNGSINFERQALYRPQDIFPSQPVTINDYRKIFFDLEPSINNVWIRTWDDRGVSRTDCRHPGLLSIYVQLTNLEEEFDKKTDQRRFEQDIIDHVKKIYAANRNLGEDLKEVVIVKPEYVSLHGTVEIEGIRDPADILAQIYYESLKYISPGIVYHTYEDMKNRGKSYEELFTGPLTKHGCIIDEDLHQNCKFILISELIGIIGDIEGVNYVENLSFGGGLSSIRYDPYQKSLPYLLLPKSDDQVKVRLRKNDRKHRISLTEVRIEFERLKFEDKARRHIQQDFAGVCPPPRGEYRHLNHYSTIQNHFPEIYGIGEYGVPEHTWPESTARSAELTKRKARARQLKAYLVFFEQIMANFLENLQELPGLFSVDTGLQRSYFHLLLTDEIVPDIEELYIEEPGQINSHIARLLERYDNFEDRRSRILDYLLGIYGEKFTQTSLRRFYNYFSGQKTEKEFILNKIKFLENIVTLSQKRALAFNYRKPSWGTDNICSLKKKVGILLGLKNSVSKSLAKESKNMENEDCYILEHILLRPSGRAVHETLVPKDFYTFRISVIFPSWTPRFKIKEFRNLAEETVRLNCPAHIQPEFCWLDLENMETFETLYSGWLEKLRDGGASIREINYAASQLIAFIRQYKKSNQRESEPDDDQQP